MVAEPLSREPPEWPDPETLHGFVDELRQAGFNLGVDEYCAVQDLLLVLAARGEGAPTWGELRNLIGPVLCSSPKEQAELGPRFERWLARGEARRLFPEPGPQPIPGPAGPSLWRILGQFLDRAAKRLARHSAGLRFSAARWVLLLSLAVVGGLLVSGLFILGRELFLALGIRTPQGPAPPQGVASDELRLALWLIAPALLGLAVAAVLKSPWWRARSLVRRSIGDREVDLSSLRVADLSATLFQSVSFFRIVQGLKRRREVPSQDVDAAATVSATLRRGGWLTPVYATRRVLPEYLVLIERLDPKDQQAKLIDQLLARLDMPGLFLTSYYFNGDPRLCFPADPEGAPLTLRELALRYCNHRLIVVSDGVGLLDSHSCELPVWVDRFAAWEERSLLTPEMREQWGARERELERMFFLQPLTLDGLAALAQRTQKGVPAAIVFKPAAPFPRDLLDRPLHWVDRNPPTTEAIESMIDALRRFLGEAGYFWLSACAAFPQADWGVTLFLGEGLSLEGTALLEIGRLRALVRTPWMRYGFLPDWLRERLLAGLPPDQERSVRSGLTEMLKSSLFGPSETFDLEVAQRRLPSLITRLLASSTSLPEEEALHDRILLTFLRRQIVDPLAVSVPSELQSELHPRQSSRTPAAAAGWRVSEGPQEDRPGTPWERRGHRWFRPYLATVARFVFSPRKAFSELRLQGRTSDAVKFAAITTALSMVPAGIAAGFTQAKLAETPLLKLLVIVGYGLGAAILYAASELAYLAMSTLLLGAALRLARTPRFGRGRFQRDYYWTAYTPVTFTLALPMVILVLVPCLGPLLFAVLGMGWSVVLNYFGLRYYRSFSARQAAAVLAWYYFLGLLGFGAWFGAALFLLSR